MNTTSFEKKFDLEYFFELSPDLLCVAGFDGYFKKINPAVSQTLGYTNEELFARPINSFVHPDDQEITHHKRESIKKNNPLLHFENRYLTKNGETVWLSWTSMPIVRDQVVFAIAKDVTYRKKIEELWRVSEIIGINPLQRKSVSEQNIRPPQIETTAINLYGFFPETDPSPADKVWLHAFEDIVRKHLGKLTISLSLISNELAISERALFRRVQLVLNMTPNKLIRVIRLQVAWEAVGSGKYRTIAEISAAAGFSTPAYFSKMFQEVYGISVLDLLK
jgi:PAS domain S-box-containing protein